jgi:hypothetical protein
MRTSLSWSMAAVSARLRRASREGSARFALSAAAFVLGVVVGGCADPPTIQNDRLSLGNDQSAGKKDTSSDDSPKQSGSTELGDGTPAADPTSNPTSSSGGDPGDPGDPGAPGGTPAPSPSSGSGSGSADCAVDADCDLGAICVATVCTPGCHTSIDCPSGASCNAGSCSVASPPVTPPSGGGGGACASDGQCNPGGNGAGMICSASGVCVAGCHSDIQCPGIKTCVTGMCR